MTRILTPTRSEQVIDLAKRRVDLLLRDRGAKFEDLRHAWAGLAETVRQERVGR